MKYLKSCNGCLKKELIDIPSVNVQICQLVTSNFEKKYFSNIKKDFKSNKFYNWNHYMESLEGRSRKNYFFLIKFSDLQK